MDFIKISTRNKCLNALGVAVLAVTFSVSILSFHANAASSSFYYAGRLIHGDLNGAYHTLDKGTVYLDVDFCRGDYATIVLKRNTSWFSSWDRNYGKVYVKDTGRYKFPSKADAKSDKYYLVCGGYSFTEGSGSLHN